MIIKNYVFDGWIRSGIQQRRSSWQDGVLGTNCPIPPKWNWTYEFQVKDQIGSFFYFPSLNFQRASGGFGTFIINNRAIIPIPFDTPYGDITIVIGDWYTQNHTVSVCALLILWIFELGSCYFKFTGECGIFSIFRLWGEPLILGKIWECQMVY